MEPGHKRVLKEFVHLPLGTEFEAIGGRYQIVKEDSLDLDGQQVLYAVGFGVFDTSCCGAGGCAYAVVPGYVKQMRSGKNERGEDLSLVEPIKDESDKKRIEKALKQREHVSQVNFL